MFLLWPRQLPQCGDWTPPPVPAPTEGRSSPSNTPVFPPSSFVLPSVCMLLYTLFQWSGTPVCSQLLFCKHFCVWMCSPDVSMERDALHVHLLLCHLVLHCKADLKQLLTVALAVVQVVNYFVLCTTVPLEVSSCASLSWSTVSMAKSLSRRVLEKWNDWLSSQIPKWISLF